jgi:hypothetical protein
MEILSALTRPVRIRADGASGKAALTPGGPPDYHIITTIYGTYRSTPDLGHGAKLG